MQRDQHLAEEVGTLDRLIAAIANEIETERTTTAPRDGLLREMENAIAELRLARGVRLMLLNAYGIPLADAARRHSRGAHPHTSRWSRAGRRVA
ncbi:MAG: hypothetical protein ACJ74J_19970 [Blastocatellia bacterium]